MFTYVSKEKGGQNKKETKPYQRPKVMFFMLVLRVKSDARIFCIQGITRVTDSLWNLLPSNLWIPNWFGKKPKAAKREPLSIVQDPTRSSQSSSFRGLFFF